MNDEQMQQVVGSWLNEGDPEPPDARTSVHQAMARMPQVRQRGRWWPLPVLRRTPQPPTATGTTDYQPSPIPANNGHAPTVIGRTQTMFSPVKAITAGALVFALGGLFLIAQPFTRPEAVVPGAPSDDATVEFVTIESSEALSEGDFDASGNEIIRMAKEASDPRLSGTWTEVWDCQGAPVEVCVASVRVENEDGTWTGRAEWFGGPPVGAASFAVLEGQGDYTGVTALSHTTFHPDEGEVVVLAVFEGELPPLPELPAE